MQTIIFKSGGKQYEAWVNDAPVPRSRLAEGQLVVEHSSTSYAIYLSLGGEYKYIAHPILDAA